VAARARDVALGLAVAAARTGTAAVRVVTLPARVVARSPAGGPLRRPAESLAASGREAEDRARRRLGSAAGDVLSGPLPEASARALVEHHVAERVAAELRASLDADAVAAALEAEATDRLVARVLASPAFERALAQVVESVVTSPEVRTALTRQSTGFAEELVASARSRTVAGDDDAEAAARRVLRRAPRATGPFAGVASRGAALVLDAALAQLVFLAVTGTIGLVVALVGSLKPEWLVATIAGAAWAAFVGAYFVGFWSVAGQTPGMRLLGVRVAAPDGGPPGVLRSLVRLIGLVLAIVPLFAGFAPVLFDRRRRALQDFLAGTTVVYEGRRAEGLEPAPAEAAAPRLSTG
jgi:uncharacterized RDD family membrane protein YckC